MAASKSSDQSVIPVLIAVSVVVTLICIGIIVVHRIGPVDMRPENFPMMKFVQEPAIVEPLGTGTIVKVLNQTTIGPEVIQEIIVHTERSPGMLFRATYLFHPRDIGGNETTLRAGTTVKLYSVKAHDGQKLYPTPRYFATQ